MVSFSTTVQAIFASATLFHSVQAQDTQEYAAVILPYADGQCKNMINGSTGTNTVEADGTPGYALYDTVTSYANEGIGSIEDGYTILSDLSFPGAEAQGSGYDVYWKVPDVGNNCRVIFMTDYTEGNYGSMGTNVAPGNVIINTGSAGCFYTNLAVDKDLKVTSCCGSDQCKFFTLGNTDLITKRDKKRDEVTETPEDIVAKIRSKVAFEKRDTDEFSSRSKNSVTARAAKAVADKTNFERSTVVKARSSTCTPVKLGKSYSQAGNQVVATASQYCSQSGCSFGASFGYSASTTLTSDSTSDFSSTQGLSVTVEAGEDLLFESASISTDVSTSIAEGTSKSTGTEIQNGTSITLSNTIIQPQGSTGFVSFTPSYTCWDFHADCGHGVSESLFTQCQPSLIGNGQMNGEYLYVATD